MPPRFLWIAPVGLAVAVVWFAASVWTNAGCVSTPLSRSLSPDSRFEAVATKEYCGDGLFTATNDRIVRLSAVFDKALADEVVVTGWLGLGQGEPTLGWSDSRTLVVEVTEKTEIHKHTVRDFGVNIELRYRPIAAGAPTP